MNAPPPDTTPPEDSEAPAPAEAHAAQEPLETDAPAEPAEASDAPPAVEKIDFDRAELDEPKDDHVECGLCKRTIHTEYWQALGKVLCASCRKAMEQTTANANGGAAFGKAFLYGGGAAIACGTGYAIFVGLSHIQFALVTIGIGWAVGTAIQKVTRGFGGRKHQILAVALTYFATTMSYFPGIVQELRDMSHGHAQSSGSSAPGPAGAPAPAPVDNRPTTAPAKAPDAVETPEKSPSSMSPGVAILLFVTFCTALMLAAPFLALSAGSGASGLLGLLIIFFGLRMAWRISKGVQATITGPHRVSASDAA
jgi:hypothetical protein